ncbi:MAG: hypothetical protein O9972_39745 [Burkholderiales bacterium]|nr:hypothetical protein [Burkholderiales bacterium]
MSWTDKLLVTVAIVNGLCMQAFWPHLLKLSEHAESRRTAILSFILLVVCFLGPTAFGFIAAKVML